MSKDLKRINQGELVIEGDLIQELKNNVTATNSAVSTHLDSMGFFRKLFFSSEMKDKSKQQALAYAEKFFDVEDEIVSRELAIIRDKVLKEQHIDYVETVNSINIDLQQVTQNAKKDLRRSKDASLRTLLELRDEFEANMEEASRDGLLKPGEKEFLLNELQSEHLDEYHSLKEEVKIIMDQYKYNFKKAVEHLAS